MHQPAELLPVKPIDTAMVPKIHAVAINATEMAEANSQIREFLTGKIAALSAEREEISNAGMVAAENGWKTGTLTAVEKRLMAQVGYYEKLLLAVDAGYTIVPNMPCDQFAIRVSRRRPAEGAHHNSSKYGYSDPFIADEKAQTLAAGEGRYESPKQLVETTRVKEEADPKSPVYHVTVRPTGFDTIEFPFAAAVPVVMTATQAALALKLFDRIGIVPQQVRRDMDPIILGQIVLRQNGRERVASFLIAWHLDLRTL